MIKKRFTLLEALIALSLFSIVLSGFWVYLRTFSKMQAQATLSIEKAEKRHFIKARLGSLLTRAVPYANSTKAVFYTRSGSYGMELVFVCDQGVDYQPNFSNETIALLYLDDNQSLCLTTWPYTSEPSPDQYRTEVLLENIQTLSFLFTDPSDEEGDFYRMQWLSEDRKLPLSVRIKIQAQDDTPLSLVYLLPNNDHTLKVRAEP